MELVKLEEGALLILSNNELAQLASVVGDTSPSDRRRSFKTDIEYSLGLAKHYTMDKKRNVEDVLGLFYEEVSDFLEQKNEN